MFTLYYFNRESCQYILSIWSLTPRRPRLSQGAEGKIQRQKTAFPQGGEWKKYRTFFSVESHYFSQSGNKYGNSI
jgi:hypothetical protein